MKIGILGAGKIAAIMANTTRQMDTVENYAVAARELNRAEAFAEKYGFEKAYGSYEEMLCDPAVELVYIATPHSHHYEHIKLCLEHGKNILCEKAFTLNAVQAAEVLTMAKEKGLLLTEAIWTRYLPTRRIIADLLASGVIGTPLSLFADLSYAIQDKPRLVDPALGGGALLDIGIYCLNFTSMIFGDDVEDMTIRAVMTETGVDAADHISIHYPDGRAALLHSDARAESGRDGYVYGTKGYLHVININNTEAVEIYNADHKLVQRIVPPPQISGYEYEVEACRKALAEGRLECPEMPHSETILMMKWMDALRAQLGIRYPKE